MLCLKIALHHLNSLYFFKKRIRMVRVELLVRPHQGDEIFRVGKIDDVVRPAGNHVHGFDFIARNLKRYFFVGVNIALLYQRASGNNDEKLPF